MSSLYVLLVLILFCSLGLWLLFCRCISYCFLDFVFPLRSKFTHSYFSHYIIYLIFLWRFFVFYHIVQFLGFTCLLYSCLDLFFMANTLYSSSLLFLLFRNASLTIRIANFCVCYIKYNSYLTENTVRFRCKDHSVNAAQWRTGGGGGGEFWGVQTPHPEIPKALQNRAILTPIVKTVKNCWI